MSTSEMIRDHCALLGISIHDLARMTGQSAENLFNKLRRDNWSVRQLQEIADATDSELKIMILPRVHRKRASSLTLDGDADLTKNWNK